MTAPLVVHNGVAVPAAAVPKLGIDDFRAAVIAAPATGRRVAALFAAPAAGDALELLFVLAVDDQGTLEVARTEVAGSYPSMTPECTQVHMFEREIAEQWGVVALGHPRLEPVRFQRPLRDGHELRRRSSGSVQLPGVIDFYRVEGEEIHEVAVGPVHAGVIEPGHFRFQCHGEHVFHLEIALGYQHRGVERALVGGPDKRTIHYMETLAGDTTIGHALAYCQTLEGLGQ